MGQTGDFLKSAGQCGHWVAGMLTGSGCNCLTGPWGNKLTLGQDVFIKVLQEVNTLLRGEPRKWLTTSRITQYQGLLHENPHVTTDISQALNLATLSLVGEGGPSHDCKELCQQT